MFVIHFRLQAVGTPLKFISSIMKKVFFASICLLCLTITSLQAQSEAASPKGAEHGNAANARTKGVGKGSPLIQRQSNTNAPAPAASEAAPAAAPADVAPAPAAAPSPAPAEAAPSKAVVPARTIAPVMSPKSVSTQPPATAKPAEKTNVDTKSATKEDSK